MYYLSGCVILFLLCINIIGTEGLKLKSSSTTWKNCGSITDSIQINSLTVEPESIHIPGNITITTEVKIITPIEAPVKAKLKIYRKTILGWIELPCINNIGSCDIDDVCSLNISQQCPSSKLPCACPVSEGTYSVDNLSIELKKDIPDWLEKGHYKLAVNLYENNYEIACYEFETKIN